MKASGMRRLGGILTAIGILAGSAQPAEAGVPTGFGFTEICGGSNFATCASASLSWVDNGTDTFVTIQVTNLGNYGEIFRQVGLINLPVGSSVSFTGGTAYALGWTPPPPPISGDGLGDPATTFATNAPTPQSGLAYGGGALTWQFTISGVLSYTDAQNLGIGIHAISGPNQCSTKLGITSGGAVQTGPYDPDCVPTNVVPEPITMALLGTGLAGIAGVAHRRRRQDGTEDETA